MSFPVDEIRRRIGRVGVFVDWHGSTPAAVEQRATAAIEALGYGALWFTETPVTKDAFVQAAFLLSATRRIVIATGVASVYVRDPCGMNAAAEALAEAFPGRFILGIGVSHAPSVTRRGHEYGRPLATMSAYLDAMEEAGRSGFTAPEPAPRVLGSVRPRMLALAAERTAGAHPFFVAPEHTSGARALMRSHALLAPQQAVLVETDAVRARATARAFMERYLRLPSHRANVVDLGFAREEIDAMSDRLVDTIVAWGDEAAIAARVRAHHEAGADHVAVQVLAPDPDEAVDQLRRLAPALISR